MPDTAKDAKLLHHRLGYDPLDNTLRGKFQSWYPDLSHVQNAVSQSMSSPLDPTDLGAPEARRWLRTPSGQVLDEV